MDAHAERYCDDCNDLAVRATRALANVESARTQAPACWGGGGNRNDNEDGRVTHVDRTALSRTSKSATSTRSMLHQCKGRVPATIISRDNILPLMSSYHVRVREVQGQGEGSCTMTTTMRTTRT